MNQQLVQSRPFLLLAALKVQSLENTIKAHSSQINQLNTTQQIQDEKVQRLSLMVASLKAVMRKAMEDNSMLRKSINTTIFMLRLMLVNTRRQNTFAKHGQAYAWIVSLILARIAQKFIGVDIILSLATSLFGMQKINNKIGRLAIFAVLFHYIHTPVARLLSFY